MKTLLELLSKLAHESASAPAKANHECCRCARLRNQIQRDVPNWEPPEAESFVGLAGARVWTGLCAKCAKLEREERISRAVAKGEHRDVAERRYGINRRVVAAHERERLGLEMEAAE